MWGLHAAPVLLSALLAASTPRLHAQNHAVFLDGTNGTYIRQGMESQSYGATSAAIAALLGLPPVFTTDHATALQVEQIIKPNPFSKPEAVFDVQVFSNDLTSWQQGNMHVLTEGSTYHYTDLEGEISEAARKAALAATLEACSGSAVVHEDLELNCSPDRDLESNLRVLADLTGRRYESADATMQGKLHLNEGSALLDLSRSDAELQLAKELACFIQNSGRGESKVFTTGEMRSLPALEELYGSDSDLYKGSTQLVLETLQLVFRTANELHRGNVVGRITFREPTSKFHKTESAHKQRHLLAADRDAKTWQTNAMMFSVGLSLFIVGLICTMCMFDMELQKDTLLYGSTKNN